MSDDGPISREPVRLPLWLTVPAVGAINFAIDLLSDVDWRTSLIGFLVTVPPLLGVGEYVRSRSWSEKSVWLASVAARRDAARGPTEPPPPAHSRVVDAPPAV